MRPLKLEFTFERVEDKKPEHKDTIEKIKFSNLKKMCKFVCQTRRGSNDFDWYDYCRMILELSERKDVYEECNAENCPFLYKGDDNYLS